MKKILIALVAVIAIVTLSSFVINKHLSQKSEMGSDYKYFTTVTAKVGQQSTKTLYIFYREDGRSRLYVHSQCKDGCGMGYFYENPLYQDGSCKDFRRNYKYCDDCGIYYFNGNFPYWNSKVQHGSGW